MGKYAGNSQWVKGDKMNNRLVLGMATVMAVLCLSTAGWAYTLELQYGAQANLADAYARQTYAGGYDEDIPGEVKGMGLVMQSASIGAPVATGAAATRPAVVYTDRVDNTQWIMSSAAAAGPTDSYYYEGLGQGYGNTFFSFQVLPGPGEPLQVTATIGYRVSGSVNLAHAGGSYNYLYLEYDGRLRNFNGGSDLVVASEQKLWDTLVSGSYSNGGQVQVLLDVNTFYTFDGLLDVRAEIYGYSAAGSNNLDFDAFVAIEDITAIPAPPALLLLAGGLACLGLADWRRRGG
jgi:hypothetical protein